MIRSPIYRDKDSGLIQEVSAIDNLLVSYPDGEPTGFLNRTSSSISFDEFTRTFSIVPLSEYTVYLKSLPLVINQPLSIQIENVTGLHYIYFDSLTKLLSVSVLYTDELATKNALVAVIYWKADSQKQIYFADERHGIVMDRVTQFYLQESIGAQYISGLSLTNIVIGDGNNDSDAEFGITDGIVRNEDIKINIGNNLPQKLNPAGMFPVLYRTNNNIWNRSIADNFPLLLSGDNGYSGIKPAHNYFDGQNWLISETNNNHYLVVHILACNDVNYPIQIILGNSYQNPNKIKEGVAEEFASLSGLPFAKFVLLATVIYQVNDNFANTTKCKIVKDTNGKDFIDWRKKSFDVNVSNTLGASNQPKSFVKVLSGFFVNVEISEHNIENIISYKIINNNEEEVSAVINLIGTSVSISSNVNLIGHRLVIKGM